ncbi:hypothetical protein GobsT_21650 [Gemmata obscuriglobus]|uniref:Uncharacterized protein n=2 Tax=Gemmata obscuriglobus TaxID=114 RepID=A0A2Z3H3R7_9BACT|nr:hypothetical protein C1280_22570 [Gemmata obscuriglobus]QEG27409.1 hypothetical protein GobsT_21650 [Gemmata obscuriglobus]VTS04335.1 unnamed protein product [Gemmata obscuriglobus UQM 2246]
MAAPALAQPPAPIPGGNLVPGAGGAGAAPPNNVLPNGLALPPGYRPRTPPAQAQAAQPSRPAPQPTSGAAPGSSGTMMYFHKPADALTATGGGLPATAGDGVAQLGGRESPVALPVPDAAPVRPVLPPVTVAPVATVPAPAAFGAQPAAQPPMQKASAGDSNALPKQDFKNRVVEVDPKEIQLPSRDKIFGVSYNDAELRQAIVEAAFKDRLRLLEKSLKDDAAAGKPTAGTEELIRNLRAVKDPRTLPEFEFPALPVVSPAGVAYQPKTLAYPASKLTIEPLYVVHRRLHFEQRNFERAGWDLGPMTTLVSAGKFYRDVLLWPAGLVSGCTYGFWDTNAGKCLPGSPTPLYLYPPNLTCGGIMAEAGLVTGFAFLFP